MGSGVVTPISILFTDGRWDLQSEAPDMLMAIGEQHPTVERKPVEMNQLLNFTPEA